MAVNPEQSDRPLRILHLTGHSAEGGVSRFLYDLGRRMREQGHEVVFAGGRGGWHDLFESAGMTWLELPLNGSAKQLWQSHRTLGRYLREHPVDVLHSHYRKSMLVARWLGWRHGIPSLTTLHSTHIPMTPMHRLTTCFGDRVHAPSVKAKQWLIDVAGVPADRITVIPHGVDETHFALTDDAQRSTARNQLGVSQDATLAGCVGRFAAQKNPLWLLDLAQASRDALPGLQLLLMGNGGMEDELREQITARNLGDRVRLLPYGDPRTVYQAFDALLLPSAYEGFALTAVEAMSMGRPAMRTDTAGADEQIVDGITGRVVPVDHDTFVRQAIAFLADRTALHRMGAAAAEHVRNHLTLEKQVQRTIALYRELAK